MNNDNARGLMTKGSVHNCEEYWLMRAWLNARDWECDWMGSADGIRG